MTEKKTNKKRVGRINNEKKNKENILIALEKTLGNVSLSCKKIGISRRAFYDLKKSDLDFSKSVDEIKEIALDFAESKLLENIKDNKESSIFFFLKTQGKNRGYMERTENLNIQVDEFSDKTNEQLIQEIEKSKKNVKGTD